MIANILNILAIQVAITVLKNCGFETDFYDILLHNLSLIHFIHLPVQNHRRLH